MRPSLVSYLLVAIIGVTFLNFGDAWKTSTPARNCFKFVRYIPSQWESDWLHDANRQGDICNFMKQEAAYAQAWLDATSGVQLSFKKSALPTPDHVWPKYVYIDQCQWTHKEVVLPIEPAVGLLRNPHSEACNTDKSQPAVGVESRDYLLLAPSVFTDHFPGRRLLFDIGTGRSFQSSLDWLVTTYEQHGVMFDEIWSWEAAATPPHEYWSTVPKEWQSKLHFYNTYATPSLETSSPVDMLREIYTAGDFVVVKLDIDNESLESIVIKELLMEKAMIAEVFFEKHFDAPEMRGYFGELATTLNDTLSLFHDFRSAGLRLHYWP